jgi:hypothetical protein
VVTSCGCGFSLNLLVLTLSGSKVRSELCPSFLDGMFLVPPTTCDHEVTCCKYFCKPSVDLLGVPNEDTPCFRIVGTILNLLEQVLNWLLRIPSLDRVFKKYLQVDRSDGAVIFEDGIQHVSYHVVIQDVQIHCFKNNDDLLLQRLLHGGVRSVSLNFLLPNVASGADFGHCSIHVGWGAIGGLWGREKDIRYHVCRGRHDICAYLVTGSHMPIPTSICPTYDLIVRGEVDTSTREKKTGGKDFNPALN